MVERYALEPLKSLWSLKKQYERWLEVELAVIRAYEELGIAPKGTFEKAQKNSYINVEEILDVEKTVDHDVIAFIKVATSKMGDESRFFHFGLTSSDIVDTANSLALVRATKIILDELKSLYNILIKKANEFKDLPTIGRTHGVHAEPTSFGLKFLSWGAETERNIKRLEFALDEISIGKLSGAVGNYANIDPKVEELALSYLGLKPTKVATQVIPRDIHALLIEIFALIASGIERIAIEIRHLQKTETLEVQEPFKKGQRGSSAMPHKKNPILCERLTGMSRVIRSYINAALENVPLWHERDISHSSVERYMFPDVTMTLYYMISKTKYLIENLFIFKENVEKNIDITKGLVYSQRVLLKLVEKGLTREEAYKRVQKIALQCWKNKKSFKEEVKKEFNLLESEINEIFNSNYYLRNINYIFDKFKSK
ncbi:adenylosuccinate lyase [Thermosipho melanesiensis]|uniref:Adenylosuccinate lyase n=2 Tax=Thermosipho melanesiensis TaxID=46541 RepID=A6LME5_THEM4|nr:adenylosuccinate lyase [Thermosipho melanesiensis]ABR31096.1 adenylosuccinate lyase [Thermosipho melanesiensis BI429]APT74191.1 adenylosuccinate lyase [Thermosipho melanesiensis]OOC36135.1 adenylosuccinate lyase [Thermosipho melanesiensis]OOC36952.1 adenylosuccinate lyase [Thermosipho melanesiensis]OOC37704.1 adenylosuccinate lyase [Thermosipho melanesiensis]